MKKIAKIATMAMACLMASSTFVGCGGSKTPTGSNGKEIDYSKMQLYIYNQGNATGSAWLDSMINRFEAEYANKEFSNGAVGIQVHTAGERIPLDTVTLPDQPYHIVFTEGATPADTYGGSFYDMTAIVNETIPGENKSIADKMSDDVKNGLMIRDGYYLLPHFESYSTPTYNKFLFDEKGLYFADDVNELYAGTEAPTDETYGFLLRNKKAKKSCGPDGVYNTEDDGLPSSIEEFKKLVDCMVKIAVKPFVAYASTYHYTNKMLLAMYATLEGYDGVMQYISRDGEMYGETQIVKLDANGKVLKNNDGTPQTESYSLLDTSANSDGYKLELQASKYYALDFYSHIFAQNKIDKYYDIDGLASTTSHTEVQRKFLEYHKNNVAFLMDSSYWENESKDAGNLAKLQQDQPEYYENEMDYRLFHLPTQYKGRVEAVGTANEDGSITYLSGKSANDVRKQVMVNNTSCYMYVNKEALVGLNGRLDSDVIETVKTFIQFMYSDKSMSEATAITGMARPMDYELQPEDFAKMSKFAKSTWEMRSKADVILPIATTDIYKNNPGMFSFTFLSTDDLFASSDGANTVRWALNGFRSGMTLDKYFEGIAIQRGQSWWAGLVR